MSGSQVLVSLFLVTIGWQLIAQSAGPVLARRLYVRRVAARESSGRPFESEAAMREWAEREAASSMNVSLLCLAAVCGAVAGALNFPLIGFSRSTNGWSWLRLVALCGVSWLVAATMHSAYR